MSKDVLPEEEREKLAQELVEEMHNRDGLAPVDIEQFWVL